MCDAMVKRNCMHLLNDPHLLQTFISSLRLSDGFHKSSFFSYMYRFCRRWASSVVVGALLQCLLLFIVLQLQLKTYPWMLYEYAFFSCLCSFQKPLWNGAWVWAKYVRKRIDSPTQECFTKKLKSKQSLTNKTVKVHHSWDKSFKKRFFKTD